MQALKIAATGMAAQQMRVDVTANNIANMSTTGYDARRASFVDLHYQQQRAPGTLSAVTGERLPVGVELGLGTRPAAVAMEPQQGTLRATGASLDLAIEGGGYF
ncbi:MAG: flagellar hook-basal body complex protein, partial [Pseudomonadota bacterium]